MELCWEEDVSSVTPLKISRVFTQIFEQVDFVCGVEDMQILQCRVENACGVKTQ
jgi:hypothetical protein